MESVWTTGRARRILTRDSQRLLGTRVTVADWRHLAIAIANRYLNKSFGPADEGRGGGGEEDEEDEGGEEGDIWALQAAHTGLTAGMAYARELQQPLLGTAYPYP